MEPNFVSFSFLFLIYLRLGCVPAKKNWRQQASCISFYRANSIRALLRHDSFQLYPFQFSYLELIFKNKV